MKASIRSVQLVYVFHSSMYHKSHTLIRIFHNEYSNIENLRYVCSAIALELSYSLQHDILLSREDAWRRTYFDIRVDQVFQFWTVNFFSARFVFFLEFALTLRFSSFIDFMLFALLFSLLWNSFKIYISIPFSWTVKPNRLLPGIH